MVVVVLRGVKINAIGKPLVVYCGAIGASPVCRIFDYLPHFIVGWYWCVTIRPDGLMALSEICCSVYVDKISVTFRDDKHYGKYTVVTEVVMDKPLIMLNVFTINTSWQRMPVVTSTFSACNGYYSLLYVHNILYYRLCIC